MLVNCLLNAFAICVGEVSVFSFESYGVVFLVVLGLSSKEYVWCVFDPSVCLH